MIERLNSVLNIHKDDLEKKGVFNSFVNLDSNLYVDISLLEFIDIPEFQNSYEDFKIYFSKIILLIDRIEFPRDIFWIEAHKKLQFKEFKFVGLGYSKENKNGNAIGPKLAKDLLETAQEIIKEGIKDPIFFELIGLIQKNISLDRISDLTIQLIKTPLLNYTKRIVKN